MDVDVKKALDYNKVWALLITLALLVLLDYLDIDFTRLIDAAALVFAVYITPNGKVPLRSSQ